MLRPKSCAGTWSSGWTGWSGSTTPLRSEVEATVSHAADKLEKAGKCLQQVSELLADQDMALEALSQAYDGTDPDKVPAPVPLNED